MSSISPVVVLTSLSKNGLRKSCEADDAVFQSITSKACSDVWEPSNRTRGGSRILLESWTAKVNKEGCQQKLLGRAFNVFSSSASDDPVD